MENFYFIQSVAIIAAIIFTFSFQAKSKRAILITQLISLSAWAFHFILLEAKTGAFLVCINAIATCFFLLKDKYIWAKNILVLLITIIIVAIFTSITWEGLHSIFAFFGVSLILIAKWQDKPNNVRWFSIPASLAWIVYQSYVGSYGGIIAEVTYIVSILIGVYRNRKDVK